MIIDILGIENVSKGNHYFSCQYWLLLIASLLLNILTIEEIIFPFLGWHFIFYIFFFQIRKFKEGFNKFSLTDAIF